MLSNGLPTLKEVKRRRVGGMLVNISLEVIRFSSVPEFVARFIVFISKITVVTLLFYSSTEDFIVDNKKILALHGVYSET